MRHRAEYRVGEIQALSVRASATDAWLVGPSLTHIDLATGRVLARQLGRFDPWLTSGLTGRSVWALIVAQPFSSQDPTLGIIRLGS